MKDRFKFRIYYKSEKKMMLFNNPTLIDGDILQGGLLFKNYDHKIINCQEVLPEDLILMQCTGLKDKNGKLIFEGDILKETKIKINWDKTEWYIISCVFWDRTQFQLGHYKTTGRARVQRNKRLDRLVEPKCKFAFCDYTPIKDFVNAEIIGNIYENPELLKGGE